jgi:sulfur-oxidizing protein SoxZ
MDNVSPRIRLPETATAGEVVTVKTLISHPMHNGERKGPDGEVIPRHIIFRFSATFNEQEVLTIDMNPSIASNPYFVFDAVVPETGEFRFVWEDEDGDVYEERRTIEVV